MSNLTAGMDVSTTTTNHILCKILDLIFDLSNGCFNNRNIVALCTHTRRHKLRFSGANIRYLKTFGRQMVRSLMAIHAWELTRSKDIILHLEENSVSRLSVTKVILVHDIEIICAPMDAQRSWTWRILMLFFIHFAYITSWSNSFLRSYHEAKG